MTAALVLALAMTANPTEVDVEAAKQLFVDGQRLYKQAEYAEAIAKFEQAGALRPHPVIFFNVGRCYEQLGETGKALRKYRDYVRLSPDAPDRDTVNIAIGNLERRLREKGLQQLLVLADPPSALISVNGKELGPSPASVELDEGEHRLLVTAPGFEKIERSFTMQLSRSTEISILLRPLDPKGPVSASDTPRAESMTVLEPGPPPPPPPLVSDPAPVPAKARVATWVVGGVALASLGAGIGMGLGAQGDANELTAGDVRTQVQNQALHDNAQTMAVGANVAYGVAAAAAVTSLILFFVER